jgi:hypothetical protein
MENNIWVHFFLYICIINAWITVCWQNVSQNENRLAFLLQRCWCRTEIQIVIHQLSSSYKFWINNVFFQQYIDNLPHRPQNTEGVPHH